MPVAMLYSFGVCKLADVGNILMLYCKQNRVIVSYLFVSSQSMQLVAIVLSC